MSAKTYQSWCEEHDKVREKELEGLKRQNRILRGIIRVAKGNAAPGIEERRCHSKNMGAWIH